MLLTALQYVLAYHPRAEHLFMTVTNKATTIIVTVCMYMLFLMMVAFWPIIMDDLTVTNSQS